MPNNLFCVVIKGRGIKPLFVGRLMKIVSLSSYTQQLELLRQIVNFYAQYSLLINNIYIILHLRVPDNLIQKLIKHQDLNNTNKIKFWGKINKEKKVLFHFALHI